MKTYRKNALGVGIFYIIGTVSGVLSMLNLGSFLNDPDYLVNMAADETNVILGALYIFIMGLALTMVPILLYPLFRKYNHVLALGAVVFRGVLEAVAYSAQTALWLIFLTLSLEYNLAGSGETGMFQHLGAIFLQTDTWLAHILSVVFSLGALMIYWVFYRTKLIPRWLSVWGLIGGVLYLISPMVGFFGPDWNFLQMLLAVQEMAMALWLIIKGFNQDAIAAISER
jgi:uncharacterized protein DUF4386